MNMSYKPHPDLDLVLERVVDVRPELVWQAWTRPEHIKRWFTPAPWKTVECEIDLRPGGRFYTVMRSPEGSDHPGEGCYLEIVENRKLVWTDCLLPGYRPGLKPFMTAMILLEPSGKGTRYTAVAMHSSREGLESHAAMGFHQGWGKALEQLVELVKSF